MILACHHISKEFPEKKVLSDVTFHLEKGDKAALIGINGAGKTTLLRIIVGQMQPDEGSVTFAKDTSFGYLAQDQGLDSESTIYEELVSEKQHVIDMEERLSSLEARMGSVAGEALEELMADYHQLQHDFQMENGYAWRGEITGVLNGLGFRQEEYGQRIGTLSGGQKTRVALGKLLLRRPEIIILDEPTNHLDITSIRWLENWIISYHGTVLIVSHDRYFLDRTVNRVVELENAKALVFHGNYSSYAQQKRQLLEERRRAYMNNQAEIRHQEEVIEKLRRFNREKSIKRAESREKMLSRIERVEKPMQIRDDMHLTLTPALVSGREVLHVEGLSKSFGEKVLFEDLGFDLRRGEHVALIGSNGTGKTTILRILNRDLAPDRGLFRLGTNVYIGYYDQEQQKLNPDNTVFEEISDMNPAMNNTQIRNLLAAFLFTGDEVFKQVGDLSGGEKGRLCLARLMLSKANFLILDEPTNHLDMISREILENALNSYEGTVLYVSHDRYFINHTASRILSLSDCRLTSFYGNNSEEVPDKYIGNYDYYLEKLAELEAAEADPGRNAGTAGSQSGQGSAAAWNTSGTGEGRSAFGQGGRPGTSPASGTTDVKADWKAQKEMQARARKAANELHRCEEAIAALEQESEDLQAEMALPENCTDTERLRTLTQRLDTVQKELESLYEEWDVLAAAVDS